MTRVLIVKFWALGDILLATPILRALHDLYDECQIDWLVDREYAGALEGNPCIHEIIAFDSGTWRRDYRYGRWLKYLSTSLEINRKLRSNNYDVTVILTPDKWWTLWFKVGKTNVGLFPSFKGGFLSRFYDVVVIMPKSGYLHNSIHYLRVVQALGAKGNLDSRMIYAAAPAERDAVTEFLSNSPEYDEKRPLIVIHPGTSQKSKCWPVENFVDLIEELGRGFVYVITGSKSEKQLADEIKSTVPNNFKIVVAAGVLKSLNQTAALIERASIVVTGDTSVLHIASAVGTPLIGIYGSTRPSTNAPLHGIRQLLFDTTVPCAPCNRAECPLKGNEYLRCQTAVTPQMAASAVRDLLTKVESLLV